MAIASLIKIAVQLCFRHKPEMSHVEDGSTEQTQKLVDREFLPFIAENLLAYIVIFQQLLPRFSRVDLASPKNSLMLYRLTKVICFV